MVTKIGMGIDLDDLSDGSGGQGHRSKVKANQLKNVIFEFLPRFSVLYLALVRGNDSCVSMHRILRMHLQILHMRMHACSNTLVFFLFIFNAEQLAPPVFYIAIPCQTPLWH